MHLMRAMIVHAFIVADLTPFPDPMVRICIAILLCVQALQAIFIGDMRGQKARQKAQELAMTLFDLWP